MQTFHILTIIFIVLKLLGYISWSWWLVLLPTWGPLAIIALFFILAAFISIF